jgi:hypothetical protein
VVDNRDREAAPSSWNANVLLNTRKQAHETLGVRHVDIKQDMRLRRKFVFEDETRVERDRERSRKRRKDKRRKR